ncbi:MAG: DUF5658 family protein [Persicimonas sp.]
MSPEEQQGLAIFATHGVADSASTIYGAATVGIGAEANPIMATLLQQGWGFAAGTMLLVTGLVAVVYPSLARAGDIPHWFGYGLAAVGLVIAVINVVVGVTA